MKKFLRKLWQNKATQVLTPVAIAFLFLVAVMFVPVAFQEASSTLGLAQSTPPTWIIQATKAQTGVPAAADLLTDSGNSLNTWIPNWYNVAIALSMVFIIVFIWRRFARS